MTEAQVRDLPFIPFSEGEKFILGAGEVTTESGIVVPVFEARAPYNYYLKGLNDQLVSNKTDEDVTFGNYPGISVGSLVSATNDALNRE